MSVERTQQIALAQDSFSVQMVTSNQQVEKEIFPSIEEAIK